ncbi:hypothetical protein [Lacrimispora sp.]|uniref:hypothetical protein n=1 Tax=Lacrimispora sp. TaxID=2719234 RepID=UPI0028A9C88D|nr:hypothetical protein [Lacrimispora sp.]
MKVTVSLDDKEYKKKPDGKEYALITKRIARNPISIDVEELADVVGNKGQTFCLAVFKCGERSSENFEQMQLFALDFDTGIPFEEIKKKADQYELPILFAYYTLSSTNALPRFRVVFANDVPIANKAAADCMMEMLHQIFVGADKFCKDVARLFLGGKKLFFKGDGKCIDIISLMDNYHRYIFETKPKKYVETIDKFAKMNNISVIESCLQIFRLDMVNEMGEFSDNDIYIYGSVTEKSPKEVKYIIHTPYQSNVRRLGQKQEPVRIEAGTLEERCRLYRDFKIEPHISHQERFLLMLNLIHISGGRKQFLDITKKKDYSRKKWEFYIKYAKDRGYKPQSCDGNCPYADECQHKENIVSTVRVRDRIKKMKGLDNYNTIEEVYNYVNRCLYAAINSKEKGMYLIPAQTAIGKTRAYCDIVCNESENRFLIAVPTNRLKKEIEKRLYDAGADFMVTLSLDEMQLPEELRKRVEYYYNLGLGYKISGLLKDFIKENEDCDNPDMIFSVNQCREYLALNSRLNSKQHLITTHAKLATLPEDIINRYTVIIDEDILTTFFKNIRTVWVETVKNAMNADDCPIMLREKLEQIMQVEDGSYHRIQDPICFSRFSEETLEELEIWDNVNDLAQASVCHRDGDIIHYFYPQDLPEGKFIILSATGCTDLYRRYFYGRHIVDYSYWKARYQGNITQFTSHSLSRQDMKNRWLELKEVFNEISRRYYVITFRCFEDKIKTGELHFGNTEGVDSLNGMDIAVIGTPHSNEFVYKLIGSQLGMEVNNDVLSVRRIQYRGYEFSLMTYKQKELRELQLYFISKELEQSIGRARLLRNDCKVIVFSNFPCEQADLVQEDYLEPDFQGKMKDSLFS